MTDRRRRWAIAAWALTLALVLAPLALLLAALLHPSSGQDPQPPAKAASGRVP